MITKDIAIFESGSGGDIFVDNNDIALVEQLYNQVYLACFGGNIEADTLGNEPAGSIREDWWGNALNFPNDPGSQFNSQTERALANNALNSAGRVAIQRAVEADLQYLSPIAKTTVNVVILSANKLTIQVTMVPETGQSISVKLIWDNAKLETITPVII